MVKKDKITYEKTKSIIEIFPDSPDFDWKIYGHKKEPENIEEKVHPFIQSELVPFLENGNVIFDEVGNGPQPIDLL